MSIKTKGGKKFLEETHTTEVSKESLEQQKAEYESMVELFEGKIDKINEKLKLFK